MIPTEIFRISHPASDSLMLMEVQKIKGKIIITETKFAQGNVVSLPAVRAAMAAAQKKFAKS